jgi:IclR family transcriptional regulator, pca regulon regulatory protein
MTPRPAATRNGKRPQRPNGREFVQALQRGFDVIRAFGSEGRDVTVTEIASRAGLTRAVAWRYLHTLQELGCVIQTGTTYSLTPRVLELGFTYLSSLDVVKFAQPSMEAVVDRLRETCSLGMLDGDDIIYMGRVPAKRIMSINLVVGSRLPAHATSMGKVLLAYLDTAALETFLSRSALVRMTAQTICEPSRLRQHLVEIRSKGYAISDQETEDGIRTIAVPVFNRMNQALAAINVSGHAARVSTRDIRKMYLPILADAARDITRSLGGRPELIIARDMERTG